MKLIPDWKRVVSVSLSFWMQAAGLLVLLLPEAWYKLTQQDYNPYLAWWVSVFLLLAGLGGRLFQQNVEWWREWLRIMAVIVLALLFAFLVTLTEAEARPVSEQETLTVAVPFIAAREGERTTAYLDAVGIPTICFGSTKNVQLGMVKSHRQCIDLLWIEVREHRDGLHKYFSLETKTSRLTPKRDAAYTSLAFNAGVGGIGKSTATRRLNAGDIAGGCEAIGWWDKAGKRVLRGLFLRRQAEIAMCMEGLGLRAGS